MLRLAGWLVLGVVGGMFGPGLRAADAQTVVVAQGAREQPTAEEIVRRMMVYDRERQAELAHYGSERVYRVEYEGPVGVRKAEVRARVEYSAPSRKQFTVLTETGSTIFCHQIVRRLMEGEQEGALPANHERAMLSPENDLLELVGKDVVDGVKTWVLEVEPRRENRFNYKGKVWVSMEDYAVVRIVGSPAKNPSWLMGSAEFDYRYARHGRFWLPQSSETLSHLRIGGEIRLTVEYGTYQIVAEAPRNVLAETTGEDRVETAPAAMPDAVAPRGFR
jgi:hypothetical protein